MYKVKVVSNFSAAHFLKNYKGKCEALHGHNWKVEVVVKSNKLSSSGMVIDFGILKNKLNNILEDLDHKNLNKLNYFKNRNPTSEEIAFYVFSRLKDKLDKKNIKLEKVKVWETENSCAIYEG
ncbi:MAG: 6-carboxytetrahydropterin synthase QueD [Candidatus Aenigmatarchaeota archaeon]